VLFEEHPSVTGGIENVFVLSKVTRLTDMRFVLEPAFERLGFGFAGKPKPKSRRSSFSQKPPWLLRQLPNGVGELKEVV
jgi:hypothetical protein